MSKPDFDLGAEDIAALGQALMSVAHELWVLNDRLMVMEDLLVEAGTLKTGAIENYSPTPERQAEIDQKSQEMIAGMLRSAGVID